MSRRNLKLSFKNEVHRIANTPENLKSLLKAIKDVYPGTETSEKKLNLKYQDSEGDFIVIATDQDYLHALEAAEESNKLLKVYISDGSAESHIDPNETSVSTTFILETKEELKPLDKRDEVTIEDEPQILETKEDPVQVEPEIVYQKEEAVEQTEEKVVSKEDEQYERLKQISRETLQEEIPTIALIVKEMLEQSRSQEQPASGVKSNKAIHHGVRCDVCGVSPIVGNRYKCSVLHDYDLCDNCEAKGDHQYPLLKIRNEAQKPVKVVTVVPPNMDVPHQSHHRWAEGFGFPRCHQRPQQQQPCGARREEATGPRPQGFENLFGGLFQHLSRPEETEKLSQAIKTGFEVFGEVLKDFEVKFEPANAGQAKTQDNSKEETKEGEKPNTATPGNQEKEKKSKIEEEPSAKKSQDGFDFVGQLFQNLLSNVIVPPQKESENKPETKASDELEEIVKKAKAIVEIFPQSAFEEVYEFVKKSPSKSLDELIQQFF